jgi:O-antigen/teichoic acid export membrane protein
MTVPTADQERREVAEGTGLASLALLINGVLNLLLLTVLTRAMPKEEFALFQLVYLVQDTVGTLLPLGLPAALAYFVPRIPEGQARALGFWTGVGLCILALPVAFALPFLAPLVSQNPLLRLAFGYLAVYLVLDLPGQALAGYLLARRRYRGYSRVMVGFTASRFASLAVPAALGASFEILLLAFVGVAVLRFAWFLMQFLLWERGSLSPRAVHPGELLAYGVPLALALIVGKVNIQVDKYLVAIVASQADFASYTLGAVELPLVASLAYSVTNALVPTLSASSKTRDTEGFLQYWHGSVIKVAAIMMPVFCFFFVLAEPAMRVLFTDKFAGAAVPFRAYLLLLPLRLCSYGAVLRSLGQTRGVLIASIAALAANAVLIYPLYLALGLAGPAIAAVVGQLVMIGLLLEQIRFRLVLPWSQVMPYRAIGRTLLVAAVSALPLGAVLLLVHSDALRLLAGAALLVASYLGLGYRTGIIGVEDLRYLRGLLSFGGRGARGKA